MSDNLAIVIGLAGSILFFFLLARGWREQRVEFRVITYTRSRHPYYYWFYMAHLLGLGAICAIGTVSLLTTNQN